MEPSERERARQSERKRITRKMEKRTVKLRRR